MTEGASTGVVPAGGVVAAIRRTYSLPVEMLLISLVVLIWQIARIPFEASLGDAITASRDMVSLEKALGIAVEPDVVRWVYARPQLLADANWFYSHMDETLVFGVLAALRLIDDVRFAAIRSAFALTHLPAIAVVALYPSAPPRWVPGLPHGRPPTADLGGDLRNSTAAAVSLHVGVPVLLTASAIWLRPRSPLAWATALYPLLVFAVVVGTANHFILDVVIGAACAALGIAGARLVHGDVPRGQASASPARIATAGILVAAVAFAVNEVILRLGG
jgi:PAP2 superfamily